MKRIIALLIVTLAALFLVPGIVWAKRAAPKRVTPVVVNSVEYSAPLKMMGFVVATDTASRKELWRVRIYNVPIDPTLERDVQEVYITSLALEGGALVVTNEKDERFTLDLATRQVTPRK